MSRYFFKSKIIEDPRGVALLESTVALTMLLPLALVAMGVWSYIQGTSTLSTIARKGVHSVRERGTLLNNSSGEIGSVSNAFEMRAALRSISSTIEQDLRSSFRDELDTLRVVMIYGEKDLSVDPPYYQEVVREERGDSTLPDPFSLSASPFSQGKNTASSTSVVTSSLTSKVGVVGVSLSVKPKTNFYSSALSAIGGSWIISDTRVVNLRGEYRWND